MLELLGGDEPPLAGGTRLNRVWAEEVIDWSVRVPEAHRWLLCDAMTSGGLLVAAPPGSALPGARIGRVTGAPVGRISVG